MFHNFKEEEEERRKRAEDKENEAIEGTGSKKKEVKAGSGGRRGRNKKYAELDELYASPQKVVVRVHKIDEEERRKLEF
jgi:hypothetical protein